MLLLNKLKNEARVVPPAIMAAATGKTCGFAPELPHAREFPGAASATIYETSRTVADGKGECMTPRFVADSEIVASRTPLGSVRLDAAASRARVGQQVC